MKQKSGTSHSKPPEAHSPARERKPKLNLSFSIQIMNGEVNIYKTQDCGSPEQAKKDADEYLRELHEAEAARNWEGEA